MIRLLVRFGKWLESRFPERTVVKVEDYRRLCAELATADVEIDVLRDDLAGVEASHNATIDRVSRLESHSAHVDAVKEIVQHVAELKSELISLKANLGWSNRSVQSAEIAAMLNGEPLNHGE